MRQINTKPCVEAGCPHFGEERVSYCLCFHDEGGDRVKELEKALKVCIEIFDKQEGAGVGRTCPPRPEFVNKLRAVLAGIPDLGE